MKVPQVRSESGPTTPPGPAYEYARKRGWIAYVLHLAGGLGAFGVHRFYLGYRRSASVQLALGILFIASVVSIRGLVMDALQIAVTVWYIVDLFLIPGLLRRRNAAIAQEIARE